MRLTELGYTTLYRTTDCLLHLDQTLHRHPGVLRCQFRKVYLLSLCTLTAQSIAECTSSLFYNTMPRFKAPVQVQLSTPLLAHRWAFKWVQSSVTIHRNIQSEPHNVVLLHTTSMKSSTLVCKPKWTPFNISSHNAVQFCFPHFQVHNPLNSQSAVRNCTGIPLLHCISKIYRAPSVQTSPYCTPVDFSHACHCFYTCR